MKSELEQQDIEAIAQRVSELLKLELSGNRKNESDDAVFDKEELADYLRTSKSTIDKLVCNNQIPFIKLATGQSGGVRFNKKDIDKWISKRTTPEINQFSLRKVRTHS